MAVDTKKSDPRSALLIVVVSIVVAFALFLFFGFVGGFTTGRSWITWFQYYAFAFGGSFDQFLYAAALFFCLGLITLVVWSLGGSFLRLISSRLRHKKSLEDPYRTFVKTAKRSRELLLVLGAIFFVLIAALAMGEANQFAPARLKDVTLIGAEHVLFGHYIFAWLATIHYPHWLITFIIFSFDNMGLIIVGVGVLLVYLSPRRLHELIISFCIGILIMIPIWLLVPVLSPQDRFIDNVYHFQEPAAIAGTVQNYHPQAEIADFLAQVRKEKTGLPALPTSTMPSAHVFWAALAGYYLFRARRWLGWIALPFLLASTFGTVLLAQHYFLDVPASLVIAAFAIWLASGIEDDDCATSDVFHGTPDEHREAVYS